MRPFRSLSLGALAVAALAAPAVLSEACSSSNTNSTPIVYGDDGGDATATVQTDASDGSTPSTDGTSSEGGSSGGDTGSPGPDGSSSGGSVDGGDANTTPSCSPVLTDAGCWTCPVATDGSAEFLNQCRGTGVHCVAFDNLAKLPGFDAGLPPLN